MYNNSFKCLGWGNYNKTGCPYVSEHPAEKFADLLQLHSGLPEHRNNRVKILVADFLCNYFP